MTVEVPHHSFLRLLLKWHGSIWRSLWKPVLVYFVLYTLINLTYRFLLPEDLSEAFENAVSVVKNWTDAIPLQFLLGFFVSYVISHWWSMLMSLPYSDEFLYYISIYLRGESLLMTRRTLARWCTLHIILVYKEVSMKVKKRFPADLHLLKNGIISNSEYEVYKKTTPDYGRWFVPVFWCANLLSDCHRKGQLSDLGLEKCSEALWRLRGSCGMLTLYDWINAPLRYIQITTFAVYGYFFICLFTRQAVKVNTEGTQVDIYVPFVLIIEFIFHVGWLKVAEENLVPFGRDDDDFSINYLLDRIHHVSFMIVDELHQQRLPAAEDPFMKEECPRLRHTIASYDYRDHVPNWKIGDYTVPQEDQVLLPAFDHFNKPLPKEYKKSLFKQLRRQGNNVVHALHLPVKRDRLNSLP